MNRPTAPSLLSEQDQFGFAIAQRLTQASDALPSDINERLRVMRQQAVERRKKPQPQTAPAWNLHVLGDSLALSTPPGFSPYWHRMASFLLLCALVIGLMVISDAAEDLWTHDMADVDAELLTDELPPDAYTDPGFIQFLRSQNTEDDS